MRNSFGKWVFIFAVSSGRGLFYMVMERGRESEKLVKRPTLLNAGVQLDL